MKILLKDIYKFFDPGKPVVRNLNLEIPSKKLTSILGPSGCGKTTTMLMIAGLEKMSNGDIYFEDQRVNEVPPKFRNIGMVFQSSALYPNMTVLDNVTFPLKTQKVPKKIREEKAYKVLEMVHMAEFANRKPHQLSGGQRQRVAIARALVKEPDLLILDEPLSALDASLRMKLREEIRNLQQQLGITTIMVTHDQEEAMSMSDMIAVMNNGELQQFTQPHELISSPENWFVAQFLGMPKMNRINCRYVQYKNALLLGATEYELPLSFFQKADVGLCDGEQLILGFRPHDINIYKQPPPASAGCLRGVVTMVEHTGRESMLSVSVDGVAEERLKILCDVNERISLNMEVWIQIRTIDYLFEREGQQRNVYLRPKETREYSVVHNF
ncbi:ABC transporter ATP-binding protein [Brevibacillus choshinensis]|uniref:ABC transporter ATP-binding protein n=1 Tax=Brevibacillus choshinensis TaxID=54911 RepID=UPI002E1B705D|nr:ABC transporter ATP-binding protein [Brevibacillus choshinensis]